MNKLFNMVASATTKATRAVAKNKKVAAVLAAFPVAALLVFAPMNAHAYNYAYSYSSSSSDTASSLATGALNAATAIAVSSRTGCCLPGYTSSSAPLPQTVYVYVPQPAAYVAPVATKPVVRKKRRPAAKGNPCAVSDRCFKENMDNYMKSKGLTFAPAAETPKTPDAPKAGTPPLRAIP